MQRQYCIYMHTCANCHTHTRTHEVQVTHLWLWVGCETVNNCFNTQPAQCVVCDIPSKAYSVCLSVFGPQSSTLVLIWIKLLCLYKWKQHRNITPYVLLCTSQVTALGLTFVRGTRTQLMRIFLIYTFKKELQTLADISLYSMNVK